MNYEMLVSYIQQFGYLALFLSLWLGIVGMPIPDEVVVMTGGAVTVNGLLHPVPAFLLTYLGVVSGLSLGYLLGRYAGTPLLNKLRRKKNVDKALEFSETLVQKYGSFAICISYFFPIVRHAMPYVVGVNRMPFRRYALFSYTAGFVWTFLFFIIGRYAGDHAREVGSLIYKYGLRFLWIPFVLVAVWAIIWFAYKHSKPGRAS
ncbi:DedA family protein [Paenibacillus sp. HWE-109]|uniref:DedA family protein n=1 Tax=Paenibacillus sp. HWE-109 TaxID=1306526 RepID=UPI001EE0C2D1|nr:DedA family protein [Paenibacillus sp. HWE-109]UKS25177.1 DedA family protein [Paenibacillus sp. HWE-109]